MKNPPPYNENHNEDTNQPAPALWTIVKDRPVLCWDCIHEELIAMGFRTYWPDGEVGTAQFVRVENNVVSPISREAIINCFEVAHILPLREVDEVTIQTEDGRSHVFKSTDLIEIYRKNMGNAMATPQLTSLQPFDQPILKDGPGEAYFPFLNCIVKVTPEGIQRLDYADLKDSCVWKSQIIQREYHTHKTPDSCMFSAYIYNGASGIPARMEAFISAIGYLLHNYTPESVTKAVIAYDEAKASKGAANGGTGKGMIAKALRQMRMVQKIEGKNYKADNPFQWNDIKEETQIVFVDDPNPQFKLTKLYSLITDGLTIQRKHKGSLEKPLSESPKWYIATNIHLDAGDRSSARRQHILTFSDFYGKIFDSGIAEPIVEEHGVRFFEQWDSEEWDAFHNYMLNCVLFYMQQGLKPYNCPSIAMNQIITNTSDDFAEWVETVEIKAGLSIVDKDLLSKYKTDTEDNTISPQIFYRYVRVYAKWKGLQMDRTGAGKRTLSFRKVTE